MIRKLYSGSSRYNIIEDNQKVGSFVFTKPSPHEISFWSFFIDEKFRNLGYGKKALSDFIARLKRLKTIEKLSLYVYKDNHNAFHIYKSLGFEVVNDTPDKITYWMELKLTA